MSLTLFSGLWAQVTVNSLTAIPNTLDVGASWAYGVNNSGVIVGQVEMGGGYRAFVYSGGTMTNLGDLGGSYVSANGINSSGLIVGSGGDAGDAEHALTYAFPGGPITDVHDSVALGSNASGFAAINASGQAAGYYDAGGHHEAILYSGGIRTDLGVPLGMQNSYGKAINASGYVVGYAPTEDNLTSVAFLYNGTMNNLGSLGGPLSFASGINDAGQIVGSSETSGNIGHAFLYNGTMQDLGTLGGTASQAVAINNSGLIVGWSDTTGDADIHTFLYSNGTLFDLNDLAAGYMSDGVSTEGFTSLRGLAINDAGQIVGYGNYFDGVSASVETAFAMNITAVPEPSTYAILAGVSALGFALWRRRSVAA